MKINLKRTIVIFLCHILFVAATNAAYVTDSVKTTIYNVANEYGIVVQNIIPISAGVMNDVYLINTNLGKKYILRRFRNNQFDRSNEEALLLNILAQDRYLRQKIVDILANKNGGYITKVDNMIFAMSSYIDGAHPTFLTNKQIDEVVKIVALINILGGKAGIDLFKHRTIENISSIDLFFYDVFKQKIINSQEYSNILSIIQNFFIALDKYPYKTTIHRDVSKCNIMVDKQENLHVIDFDDFIVASPIIELSVLIRGIGFVGDCEFNLEIAKKIISLYNVTSYTKEKLDILDIYNMLLYDVVRCAQGRLSQPNVTVEEKKRMFKETYSRILLIQKYKQVFLNTINI